MNEAAYVVTLALMLGGCSADRVLTSGSVSATTGAATAEVRTGSLTFLDKDATKSEVAIGEIQADGGAGEAEREIVWDGRAEDGHRLPAGVRAVNRAK